MITAVMADKGGVGKTTAVQNLGVELAHLGHRVLLMDADKQADLTELCGVESTPAIGLDAIMRQTPPPPARNFVRHIGERIDLIGTHPMMRKADRELAQRTRREYVLAESLDGLQDEYGAVVIDVGHSDMLQLNVLAIADAVVIATTPAKLDADHITNMLDEAEVMRRDLRLPSLLDAGRIVVNITRRSAKSSIEDIGLELITAQFENLLAPSVIPFTPRAIEASAMHLPLRAFREQHGTRRDRTLSAAVDAYAALAHRIADMTSVEVAA